MTPIESTAELTFVWLKIVCVAFEHGFSWLDITSHNTLRYTVFDGSKPGDLTRSEESYISSESCHTSECRKSGYNKRPIVVSAKPVIVLRLSACGEPWRVRRFQPTMQARETFNRHRQSKGPKKSCHCDRTSQHVRIDPMCYFRTHSDCVAWSYRPAVPQGKSRQLAIAPNDLASETR